MDGLPIIFWLNTEPAYRVAAGGFNHGQRGWNRHAVVAPKGSTFADMKDVQAACGTRPKRGWTSDPTISVRCTRCVKIVEG